MADTPENNQCGLLIAALNEIIGKLSFTDLRKVYMFARTLKRIREEDKL